MALLLRAVYACYYSVVSFSLMHPEITAKLSSRAALLFFVLALALNAQTLTGISLSISANPALLGRRVTLAASINPSQAAGEVTFYDGSVILGIAPAASGYATLSTILLNPGRRSLQARFESHSGFAASASQGIAVTVNAAPSSALTKPVFYPTASAINQNIAVADFNGDGRLDIVTNNFTVLMGNGDGTFQPPVNYTAQTNAYALSTGDFNGDGKPDFASADYDGTLGVWLNKGDGTFLPPAFYQVGAAPLSIAVADFNDDGIADVAVASRQGNYPGVGVFIGVGDGTFKPPVNYLAPRRQQALAIGDFNGDGNADIVSVDSDDIDQNVTILLGAGDGTFHTGATYGAAFPYSVAVGDFNKDGRPDFVLVNEFASLTVFLGNGDGTFAQQPMLPVPLGSAALDSGLSVGDFDGDGNPDIAYAGDGSDISVFLGNGDGTFRGGTSFPAGSSSQALVAAEFNGDGRTDLAVTNGSNVQILLGASGDFPTVTTTSLPGAMAGVPYLATLQASGGAMPYSWAVSDGTPPVPLTSGGVLVGTPPLNRSGPEAFTVTVSGANGPGFRSSQNLSIDVAPVFKITYIAIFSGEVGSPYSLSLQVTGGTPPYQNWKVASGSLPPGVTLDPASGQFSGTPTAAGEFSFTVTVNDSTGLTSLPASISIFVAPALSIVTSSLPNGFVGVTYYSVLSATGGFPPYQNWTVSKGALPPGLTLDQPRGVISGTPTSASGSPFSFTISVAGAGYDATSRAFTIAISNAVPVTMTLSSSANPSGLGKPITLTATLGQSSASGKVTFFDGVTVLGTAAISSAAAQLTVNLPTAGKHLLHARYIGPQASASMSQVVNASPDASFLTPVSYVSGNQKTGTATPVVIADFNGDGKPDLATFASVLLGNGDGTFQAPLTFPTFINAASLIAADFNEDGIPDIAISEQGGLHVLLGKGDGTLQTPTTYELPVAGFYGVMTAADFKGDGHVDLFVTGESTPPSPSQLYLGVGDGTFRPPLAVTTGVQFTGAITAADFNGDGNPDVALEDGTSLYIQLGRGDGTFSTPVTYPLALTSLGLPPSATSIAAFDINGDGIPDVAVLAYDKVSVFLGRGDGTFRAPSDYVLDPNFAAAALAIGDFNGDGVPDLAVARNNSAVTILLGNGDGSFTAGGSFASGDGINFSLLSTGDFNGDGLPDLVVGTNAGSIDVVLGSSIAGANQVTVSPEAINVNLMPGGSPVTQTVTLTYQTTSPGSLTFLLNFNSDQNWLSVSPLSGPLILSSKSGSLYTYTAQVEVQIRVTIYLTD